MYLKAFIRNFVKIDTVVSEKIQFEFLYVHNLGPRSRNDLDLQYSHTFIYVIRCLLLLPFRSLAAIVSEKSTYFTFSYRKASREFHNNVPPEKVSLLCRKFCVINKPFTENIVYFCLQDICLPEKMIYDKHIHVRFPSLPNIASKSSQFFALCCKNTDKLSTSISAFET